VETVSKVTVGIICGGSSAEAEVSRSSAGAIVAAAKRTFGRVLTIELNSKIPKKLLGAKIDVAFPVLHGSPGEDGTVQGFLEIMGIPYVGSGVLASACAMNKVVAKHIFRSAALPTAPDTVVCASENRKEAIERVLRMLGTEVVVKPAGQGSAIGVGFANDEGSLEKALDRALEYDEKVLVEKRVVGKEVTVALLENERPRAFPVVEVRLPANAWYDYAHRYTPGLSEHVIPAELSGTQTEQCQAIAEKAHAALGCRDLSRVDFVVPAEGDPIILEVNTLPGMTPTSLYPDAARAGGFSFEKLVAYLVERALSRSLRATTQP
jgi:D-alanine-D-alanine ligase